jgi:hypothetical protein
MKIKVFNQEGWPQKKTTKRNTLYLGGSIFVRLESTLQWMFFLAWPHKKTTKRNTLYLGGSIFVRLESTLQWMFFLATLLIKNLDFPAWRQGVAAATRKTNIIYKSHQISYTSKSNLTKSHFAPLCLHSYCTFLGPEGRGITMIAFLFNIYLAFSLIWASPENNKHEIPSF